VICGVPAVGKSTLAAAVSAYLGWLAVSSDVTRKELAGIGLAD
jgi:predicted kinase